MSEQQASESVRAFHALRDAFLPGGRVSAARVWFATATGPVVWFAHLAAASFLVPLQCRIHTTWMVNALTAICAVVIAWSTVIAWRMHAAGRRSDAGDPARAVAFVGLVGFLWGAISLLVTVVEGMPNTILTSCPR